MTEFDKDVHEHIKDAIYLMLLEEPFFAHIALGVKWYQDTNLRSPSVTTDGLSISYNPNYIREMMEVPKKADKKGEPSYIQEAKLNLRNMVGSVCLKIALRHAFRAVHHGMDDKQRAAVASDIASHIVVKNVLKGGQHPCMGALLAIDRAGREKLIFEQIYELLPAGGGNKQNEPNPKNSGAAPQVGLQKPSEGDQGGKGKSGPHSAQGSPMTQEGGDEGQGEGGGQGDIDDQEYEIKQLTGQAMEKAKKAGKLPGDLKRSVDESYEGRKDWRDQVRKFLGGGQLKEQSWSRPNRRYIADGLFLPGMPPNGPGTVVLAIDTSGSIDDALLSRFMAEMRKLHVDLAPDKLVIVAADSRVQWTGEFGPFEDLQVEPKGRGGTDFAPTFRWVEESGIRPNCMLYFTDCEVSSWGKKPDFPVMFIVWPGGSQRQPPFGEVVRV